MSRVLVRSLAVLLALPLASCLGGGDDDQVTAIDPPVGKHVLFVRSHHTASGSHDSSLHLADTGDASFGQRLGADVGDLGAFRLGPADDDFLSYVEISDGSQCRGTLRVERRTRTGDSDPFISGCIANMVQSRSTGRMILSFAEPGTSTDAQLAVSAHFDERAVVYQIDTAGANTALRSVNNVALAEGGLTAAYVDDTGTNARRLSSLAQAAGEDLAHITVDADEAASLRLSDDGERLVYLDSTNTRLKFAQLPASGAAAPVFLTPALAGGDNLGDDFKITADGSRVFYLAYIGGVRELRMVATANPLVEVRADSIAAPLTQFFTEFDLSPDGTQYAYTAEIAGERRVVVGDATAPGAATAVSPSTDFPDEVLRFVDDATVAYVSDVGGNAAPIGQHAVRSVALAAPGTSTLLSPVGLPTLDADDLGVMRFTVCDDGTLVYVVQGETDPINGVEPMWNQLYAATPGNAASVRALTARFDRPTPIVKELRCLP